MPLSEIPKYLGPETRKLVEAALEDAWDELSKDGHFEPTPARKKLTSTMVALASVGETDHRKLKWFAIHACRGAMQAEQSAAAQRAHELAKRQLNRPQNLRFLFGLVVTTAMEWRSHRRRANNPGRGERPERSSATNPIQCVSAFTCTFRQRLGVNLGNRSEMSETPRA